MLTSSPLGVNSGPSALRAAAARAILLTKNLDRRTGTALSGFNVTMRRRRSGAPVRWAVLIIALTLLGALDDTVSTAGTVARRIEEKLSDDTGPPGRWRTARGGGKQPELTEEQEQEIARLRSIGYLTGSQAAPATSGVTVHDRGLTYEGLNFFSSGHRPGAALMDMEGRILHEWESSVLDVWPDKVEEADTENAQYWRGVHLFPNGDVLAIFEGIGIVKFDRNSNIVWKRDGGEHHDLHVQDDGTIYVLTRKAHVVRRINSQTPILEDFITVLDSNGNHIESLSLLEAFERSRFETVMKANGMQRRGDLYHTNAIEVLDGRHADKGPQFRKGNVLVSLRLLSVIAIVDMDLGEVVWVMSGMWLMQHDPTLLPNGNVLLFDNMGHGVGRKSKVLEFDPLTQERVWMFAGDTSKPFYTQMCGAARRLPNGNTLITESDYGRAFEVTLGGSIVWEYLNPERAGERDQLIGTLFEVIRLPADFPIGWARGR